MIVETFKNRFLRYFLTVFGLTSVLLFSVSVAYGADQGYGSFWFGPDEMSSNGVKYYNTGVVASNKYDAALYALGFSKSTVTGISNSKKNKLIANSTFSSFANGFKTGKPDDDAITVIPGIPTVGLNTNSMLTAWYAANAMYGESNCYWSIYSKDSADSAEDAAYKIIKGGSSSGGGGSGSGGSTGSGSGGSTGPVSERTTLYYSGYGTKLGDYDTVTAILDETRLNQFNSFIESNNGKRWFLGYGYDNHYSFLILYDDGLSMLWDENGNWKGLTNPTDNDLKWYRSQSSYTRVNGDELEFYGQGSQLIAETIRAGATKDNWNTSYISVRDYGYGDDEPTEPPIEWPTEPTTPVVPPEPPDPVEPDPPTPWNPIPDIDITITGDDFQDLLDALNEHCIHLQTSINDNVSQLWQLQSELFTNQLGTFWDNLHNDLLWLGECLNFDVNVNVDTGGGEGDGGEGSEGETNTYVPFDDTSIIYWLKQIWSKLGNGISIEPVDPVVSNDDWWDWLLSLMGNFVSMLLGFGAGSLSGVVEGLQGLTTKFPFSLPWDLVAMLAMLDAPAVTPEWDFPCFAVGLEGLEQVGTYHISLDDYDEVWENIRWIERLSFIVLLIKSSDWFTGIMRRAAGRD